MLDYPGRVKSAWEEQFEGVITQPSYNCDTPPNTQTGWVIKVEKMLNPERAITYPVGAEVAFAYSCFNFGRTPEVGDRVTVHYNDEKPKFCINQIVK